MSTQGSPLQEYVPLEEESTVQDAAPPKDEPVAAEEYHTVAPPNDEPSAAPAFVEESPEVAVEPEAQREVPEATTESESPSEPQAPIEPSVAEDLAVNTVRDEEPIDGAVDIMPENFIVLVNDSEIDSLVSRIVT